MQYGTGIKYGTGYKYGWSGGLGINAQGYLQIAGPRPGLDPIPAGTYYYETPASHIVNLGTVKPCYLSANLISTVFGAADFDGVVDVDAMPDWDQAAAGAASVTIQISISLDGFTWGSWQYFYPGTYKLWKVKFRLVICTGNTSLTPVVSGFNFTVDMPDRIKRLQAVVCPAGGLPVTFTPPFAIGPAVSVEVLNAVAGDVITFPVSFTGAGGTILVTNGGVGVQRTIDATFLGA